MSNGSLFFHSPCLQKWTSKCMKQKASVHIYMPTEEHTNWGELHLADDNKTKEEFVRGIDLSIDAWGNSFKKYKINMRECVFLSEQFIFFWSESKFCIKRYWRKWRPFSRSLKRFALWHYFHGNASITILLAYPPQHIHSKSHCPFHSHSQSNSQL